MQPMQRNASAAEEMNAQAEEMKSFVGELVSLMGGSTIIVKKTYHEEGPKNLLNSKPNESDRELLVYSKAKEIDPNQVIPMDDAEFKDL